MKKLIFLIGFILFASLSVSAEVLKFRGTHYAMQLYEHGKWQEWSDWAECNVIIGMDLDTDVITILAKRDQIYHIYDYVGTETNNGTTIVTFLFYDQDDDKGTLSLQMRDNGQSEIYIEFSDIHWAYIVRRIN